MSICSPSALESIILSIAPVFNSPSAANFSVLVHGWILAGCRGTVSRAIRAAAELAPKHFSSYYRFFSRAEWGVDALGVALLPRLLPFADGNTIKLIVDDTLTRKGGRHIWGANMHHDPLHWMCNASRLLNIVVVRDPKGNRKDDWEGWPALSGRGAIRF